MTEPLTDLERVLKLADRVRLLTAISEEIPIATKLNVQGLLKIFEATVAAAENPDDEARAAGYYQAIYHDLEPYADIEALLSAMRVFAPYL